MELRKRWRLLITECRLALAEWLVFQACRITPSDHPDSIAIVEAAQHVAAREPSTWI